jgi:hypothetical protein
VDYRAHIDVAKICEIGVGRREVLARYLSTFRECLYLGKEDQILRENADSQADTLGAETLLQHLGEVGTRRFRNRIQQQAGRGISMTGLPNRRV